MTEAGALAHKLRDWAKTQPVEVRDRAAILTFNIAHAQQNPDVVSLRDIAFLSAKRLRQMMER